MPTTLLPWFDSHCHFDFSAFDNDREEHWRLAQKAGVKGLVIPGITKQQGERLSEFCNDNPWFYAQGLHPYFLAEHQNSDLDWLEQQLLSDADLIAVGEIGLDKVLAQSDDETAKQQHYFYSQVELAKAHKKKLILHIRGTHDEACAYLRRQNVTQGGIVHAFSGSEQQAKAWIDLGFKLGIGGAMTHSRANKLRRTIKAIPAEFWLLETDSPDMKPAFWKGPNNSPMAIPLLAACIAAIKKMELSELSTLQQQSLTELFPSVTQAFN